MAERLSRFGRAGFTNQTFLLALLPIVGLTLNAPLVADAQVTHITPSDLTTQVNQVDNSYNIIGGIRPGGGPNLFHSFVQFDVGQTAGINDIANFLNDSGIDTTNILARVTGPHISQIYGTIRIDQSFGNANLFLINPSGIVLGPSASLNVGGSVSFTSAQYLRLFDGVGSATFYANPANDGLATSILTIDSGAFTFLNASPAAYGFRTAPDPNATITVEGSTLTIPNSPIGSPLNSISLVGGNVVINGGAQLSAPSGTIKLASAASPGEFDIDTLAPLPNTEGTAFATMGAISLSQSAVLNVSGQLDETGSPIGTGVSGTVYIRSGQLVMDAATIRANTVGAVDGASTAVNLHVVQGATLSNSAAIYTQTSGTGRGGTVQITAGALTLNGASLQSSTTGDGNGGDISITDTHSVSLTNGAQIVSRSDGSGKGGNITILATDTISISGYDTTGTLSGVMTNILDLNTFAPLATSGVFTSASTSGDGGSTAITAPVIAVDDAGTIATINAGGGLPNQKGGDVELNGKTISFTTGGQLLSMPGFDYSSFSSLGSEQGGNLTVTATDSLLLSGLNPNPNLFSLFNGFTVPSSITSFTANPSGNGGNITVGVSNLNVTDNAAIQSINISPGVDLDSDGVADVFAAGGMITVQGLPGQQDHAAESVNLSSFGNITSQSNAPDSGGDIVITSQTVQLDSGATINSGSLGFSDGGNISFNVGDLLITNFASINSANDLNTPGPGGNIQVQGLPGQQNPVARSVRLNSLGNITSLSNAPDRGGDIVITSQIVQLDTSGSISSGTSGSGDGGNITIKVDTLELTNSAAITSNTSSPETGHGGNITVNGLPNAEKNAAELVKLAITGRIATEVFGAGDGGNLLITSKALDMETGGVITTVTQSTGNGGNVVLRASDLSLSTGSSVRSITNSLDSSPNAPPAGDGGTVTVQGLDGPNTKAHSLTVSSQSGIISSASGSGRLGDIELSALTVSLMDVGVIQAGSQQDTGKEAGNVTINADTVGVSSGSRVSSQVFAANAGQVTISTSQLVLDDGAIETSTQGIGQAGNVALNVEHLSLANGSTINSKSLSTDPGAGTAGSITIQGLDSPVNLLTITNSSISTSAAGTGQGGRITVDATNLVLNNATLSASVNDFDTLDSNDGPAVGTGNITFAAKHLTMHDSRMTVESSGTRNAGDIAINSQAAPGKTFRMSNSQINTSAALADGGNVGIYFTDLIRLTDSTITSSVGNEQIKTTKGGNITIDPAFFIAQRSGIRANAFAGTGGAIDITAGLFLADASSVVDASSTKGVSGTVQINAPINNLSEVVARLPESLIEVQALLRAACAARMAQGETSSFVERGRDSIPAGPEGLLASPYIPMVSSHIARTQAPPSMSLSGLQLRRLPVHEPPAPVMIRTDHAACSS